MKKIINFALCSLVLSIILSTYSNVQSFAAGDGDVADINGNDIIIEVNH